MQLSISFPTKFIFNYLVSLKVILAEAEKGEIFFYLVRMAGRSTRHNSSFKQNKILLITVPSSFHILTNIGATRKAIISKLQLVFCVNCYSVLLLFYLPGLGLQDAKLQTLHRGGLRLLTVNSLVKKYLVLLAILTVQSKMSNPTSVGWK